MSLPMMKGLDMSEVKVEIATVEDAEDIAKIAYQVAKMHDEAMPEYFKTVAEDEQLRNIREMLNDNKITVFKAVVAGKVCGFLFLEMIHRQSKGLMFSKLGYVLNLGVDEVYRGQGIGTALIAFAEKHVREQGGEALDLNVFAFNKDAIRLYERLGYDVIDVSMRKVLK